MIMKDIQSHGAAMAEQELPVLSEFYNYQVHGMAKAGILAGFKKSAGLAMDVAVSAGGNLAGVGRAAKAGTAIAGLPVVAQITQAVSLSTERKKGRDRFDAYLKQVEDNPEIVNEFYSACSRKTVKPAEEKGDSNQWVISLEEARNKKTYPFDFWGIEGNTMTASLSGELKNGGEEIEGTYTGTMKLNFEVTDFSPLDTQFEQSPGISAVITLLYSMGGYHKTSDTGKDTMLQRYMKGELSLYVTESTGSYRPRVTGSLSSQADDTCFAFDRKLVWHDESAAALGALGVTEAEFVSGDIHSVTMKPVSRVEQDGVVKVKKESIEEFSQYRGSAFRPLESEPVITIRFDQ